jgi:hypothetical protein
MLRLRAEAFNVELILVPVGPVSFQHESHTKQDQDFKNALS